MARTILIISNVRWWNAEAAYAAAAATALQKAGHRVLVWSLPGTKNAAVLAGLELEQLILDNGLNDWQPWQVLRAFWRLKRLISKYNIDVVNAFRSEGLFLIALAAGTRLVRARGDTRTPRKNIINNWLYGAAPAAWVLSAKVVGERIRTVYPQALRRPAQVLYYPVSIVGRSADTRARYDQLYPRYQESLKIAIVGRLSAIKGHDILLEAFDKLRKDIPQLQLFVVYKDAEEDQARLHELQQQAAPFAAQVSFMGPQSDLAGLMSWVDIGVVPSTDSEVNCRVCAEFMAVGTPVVAFATGALPEVIVDQESGVICAEKTAAALADALHKLAVDKGLRQELGRCALARARAHFNIDNFAQALLAAYGLTD